MMPYSEKLFARVTCGKAVFKRAAKDAQVRCLDCAIGRSVNWMLNMRHKRGSDYRKWADGMMRAARVAQAQATINDVTERRG